MSCECINRFFENENLTRKLNNYSEIRNVKNEKEVVRNGGFEKGMADICVRGKYYKVAETFSPIS
ncbi:aminoacylase [Bacillus pseudomycoides]|nr:aminoacylase [Bacillus pseudomycoides]PEM76915.1 aminoacylase [Bacillus pseudomycoides]PHC89014.1 aminoacylase [Bacillus pseudomycoides]